MPQLPPRRRLERTILLSSLISIPLLASPWLFTPIIDWRVGSTAFVLLVPWCALVIGRDAMKILMQELGRTGDDSGGSERLEDPKAPGSAFSRNYALASK